MCVCSLWHLEHGGVVRGHLGDDVQDHELLLAVVAQDPDERLAEQLGHGVVRGAAVEM